ncbi:aminotransferase class I/II-fold pyridoxal phosphate-dependent enzyme [Streptomyces pseudovenezuelae]|uniref:aminotransferase class I/II-fold pyridoxal phosphate-dependent enzyme n=1 Tax=Streptomyces pseudovenezuelae TaxID=67350 RepID=UPI002475AE26|nr:aminotransferase class I/II-fold pyridoxal phosphate-dependent enzyme [Streptomyces pseudovenezuelae]
MTERAAAAVNRALFDRTGLVQGRYGLAGAPETGVKVFGRMWSAPVVVGPHPDRVRPERERAAVRASAAAGLPAVVTTAPWSADPVGGDVPLWLDITAVPDRRAAHELAGRAQDAGFGALTLRLAPDPGPRPPVDWSALPLLRAETSLPLLIAGTDTAQDALRAIEAGADGVVTSALRELPAIADAVAGGGLVLLSGGIRRGADILVALASGADAVVLRPTARDGVPTDAVGGDEAADRSTDSVPDLSDLQGLVREFARAMEFTGAGSVTDLGREVIRVGAAPAEPAPAPTMPEELRRTDLHSALSDPVLDTMNFLNEITFRYPDAISFAPGRPYDGFFDTEQIFTHARRYLDHLADQGRTPQEIRTALYQYGPTAGMIREIIAESLMADEGIDVPAESLVVTLGAQEAMLLALRALIGGPDDVLLVSSPCYVGIIGAARLLDIEVHPVEEREDGLACADVEAAIRELRARGKRPRVLYVLPDHANPSGNTLDLRTRTDLLRTAARHGLLILEDSPYRMVSPGPRLPTLKALDRARTVVHLGSFSKTVFPGARVGYVVADQPVADGVGGSTLLAAELAKIKSMITVNTPSLSQATVAGALLAARGRVSEMNSEAAAYYGEAMRSVLQRLDSCLPADRRAELGVRWNEPAGGFFLSVQVPFRADEAALSRSAQEFGVIWTPMEHFHPLGGGRNGIRLSISYLTPAEIQEGIARLTRFIEAECAAHERSEK